MAHYQYTLLFKYTYESNQTIYGKIKPNKYKNKIERSGSVNKNNKRAIELVQQ